MVRLLVALAFGLRHRLEGPPDLGWARRLAILVEHVPHSTPSRPGPAKLAPRGPAEPGLHLRSCSAPS
eukprot:6857322-Pyramimonas_sp.AAC.1